MDLPRSVIGHVIDSSYLADTDPYNAYYIDITIDKYEDRLSHIIKTSDPCSRGVSTFCNPIEFSTLRLKYPFREAYVDPLKRPTIASRPHFPNVYHGRQFHCMAACQKLPEIHPNIILKNDIIAVITRISDHNFTRNGIRSAGVTFKMVCVKWSIILWL
ncbi:hypothetical protein BDD12DRAFT_858650 [Trichophaea hybrida]|nr:hypothetical protein BDD12DRAFT_858650 [Trichophaea hybrida]